MHRISTAKNTSTWRPTTFWQPIRTVTWLIERLFDDILDLGPAAGLIRIHAATVQQLHRRAWANQSCVASVCFIAASSLSIVGGRVVSHVRTTWSATLEMERWWRDTTQRHIADASDQLMSIGYGEGLAGPEKLVSEGFRRPTRSLAPTSSLRWKSSQTRPSTREWSHVRTFIARRELPRRRGGSRQSSWATSR
jgi:hypothetical protein